MCAPSGPGGKQTTSPSPELVLAAGVTYRDAALEDDEPLLLGVLVVVRADALAGGQLVERGPHLGRSDRRAEPGHTGPEAGRIGVVVLGRELVEVDPRELAHASACRCASTNQRCLSIARDTSVKRSEVSMSPSSESDTSIASRTDGPVGREPVGDQPDGLLARRAVERVLVQGRGLGRHPNGSGGEPAQCGRPLGDLVDEAEHALGDRVVELVQLDEVGPLDVPVRLLELAVEVERVRETGVEQLDELLATVGGEVVTGLERDARLGRHGGSFPRGTNA